jgi:hypothetical protein
MGHRRWPCYHHVTIQKHKQNHPKNHQDGAPKIAFSWFISGWIQWFMVFYGRYTKQPSVTISNHSMVYGRYNYS